MSIKTKIQQIKADVVQSFSTKISEDFYVDLIKMGLGKNEKNIVKKYFKKSDKILDLGCGTGRIAQGLYDFGYKNVVGVDLVPKMIELAKRESQYKKIKYFVGDATKLYFKDNSFDAVIFGYNGWSQIPGEENRQKVLKEVYRVLKPGGLYVFTALIFRKSCLNFFRWMKFYLSRILRLENWALEYGDVIQYRYSDFTKKFIHIVPRLFYKGEVMKIFAHYYPTKEKLQLVIDLTFFNCVELLSTYKAKNYEQFQIILRKQLK